MNRKLIITRVILILAFVTYLVSLLMPYKMYYEDDLQIVYTSYAGGRGYDTEYILFFFFLNLFVFFIFILFIYK